MVAEVRRSLANMQSRRLSACRKARAGSPLHRRILGRRQSHVLRLFLSRLGWMDEALRDLTKGANSIGAGSFADVREAETAVSL